METMKATEIGGTREKSFSSAEENVSGYYIPPRAKTLKQLLQYTTVEHLLANNGQIQFILDTDTVETALETFRNNDVQSVPVYSSHNKSKFIGIVDSKDILDFMFSLSRDQLDTYFFQTKVKQLIEISKIDSTPMVSIGTPLLDVLQTLCKGEAHRVGVLDPQSGSLFNIISQMSLVQFIAKNISLLEQEMREMPVSQFMKKIITVETLPIDTTTLMSFDYLFRRNISAAAVVDLDGAVVDTLSISDLVGVLYDKFSHLGDVVISYLQATRRTKATKPPLVCHMEDTFEYVVLKLASTKVHRLWVVEEVTNVYMGLANLTDVLSFCATEWVDMME